MTGPTLRTVVETTGSAVLTAVHTPRGIDVPVYDLVVHDRRGMIPPVAGGLLLAVGLSPDDSDLAHAMEQAAKESYAGVIVKALGADLAALESVAARTGVAVLATADDMDWRRLDGLVSNALRRHHTDPGDGPTLGDLFGLANAVALSVGGAIAIEDQQRRVLAYSNLPGQPIDEVRRQGILGRQVPDLPRNADDYRSVAHAHGVVRFAPVPPDLIGRMGIAVRAGTEFLGSLWAVDEGGRLGPDAERALIDAARIAALHLLRARSRRGVDRSERAETLRALLTDGDVNGRLSAVRHGLTHQTPVVVVAFSVGTGDVLAEGQVARLADLVSLHLEAWHADTLVATSGGIVYAALPLRDEAPNGIRQRVAEVAAVAHRSLGVPVRAAIGAEAAGTAEVADSARAAERVLQALTWADSEDVAVATFEEQRERMILQDFLDGGAADDEVLLGPVRLMLAHDARSGTDFARSVLVYLDADGAVPVAADRLTVHVNTLRHRLRRTEVMFGLDLTDPDTRLVTWLQLRLLSRRRAL